MKKIYTEKFKCAYCGRYINEYSKNNKDRALTSWVSICLKCYRKLLKLKELRCQNAADN